RLRTQEPGRTDHRPVESGDSTAGVSGARSPERLASERGSNEQRTGRRKPRNREEISMAIAYDSPLYVLPFVHRATFSKTMCGWEAPPTPEQTAQVAAMKDVIYDAFKAAVADGVPKERAGILVDEQFGASILRDASNQGFITACPAERSGQDEFDFEHGEDFG